MKNLSNSFITEKNKRTNKPIVLFTLHDYDGAGTNLYFTEYDSDVTYNGVTYTRFPIKYDTVGENTQGQVDSVRITLGNVSRIIQAYLETYDFSDKKVTISIVWANLLSDVDAHLDYTFHIDTYSSDANNAEFILTTRLDVLDKFLPGGIYLRTHCRWKTFKDTNTCGYTGAETECNRTMQRCKELNNFLRFGGFPSVPVRRLYVT